MVFHKSYRDGVLKLSDGTGSPVVTTLSVVEGDLNIRMSQTVETILSRGALHEFKLGDEVPMEFSFTIKLDSLVAATAVTAFEVFTNSNGASAQTTTRAATNVFCIDMIWELLDESGSVEETLTIPDCCFTSFDFREGMPYSTYAVSGKSLALLPTIS